MRIVLKTKDSQVETYDDVRSAEVILDTGKTITFLSSQYDLVYVNGSNVQLFALKLENK